MIIGIGCDIVAVARIKRAVDSNPNFVERLFTPAEIAYSNGKASYAQSYATRFAAKEAVMKALGTGWDGKVNWLDIEVLTTAAGSPYVNLSGGAKSLCDQKKVVNIQLSLSHEKEHALAFVILEA